MSYVNNVTGAATQANYIDAVYADSSENQVSVDDFLQLMVKQLQNQDFMNPVDNTEYLSQLAQFASMQQMKDLAYYSKSNFLISLVGKNVTVAKLSIGGNLEKVTGNVEKISMYDNEYKLYVDGNEYSLNQIMEIEGAKEAVSQTESQVQQ
jgi:flagellar hook assembly protein FlgD